MKPNKSQILSEEIAFFDKTINESKVFDPFTEEGWLTLNQEFRTLCRPDSNDHLLDVGCGTGSSSRIYTPSEVKYTGIDLSPLSIQQAKINYPNFSFLVGDACRLPFENNTFTIVAFSSVLHHIPNYDSALQEAFRVLKPGGKVFAYDPNALNPAMALFRVPSSPFYLKAGVSPNEAPLIPKNLINSFKKNGLESVKQKCRSGIEYKHVAPKAINSLLKIYNALDKGIEFTGLGKWFGTFIITVGTKPKKTIQKCSDVSSDWR